VWGVGRSQQRSALMAGGYWSGNGTRRATASAAWPLARNGVPGWNQLAARSARSCHPSAQFHCPRPKPLGFVGSWQKALLDRSRVFTLTRSAPSMWGRPTSAPPPQLMPCNAFWRPNRPQAGGIPDWHSHPQYRGALPAPCCHQQSRHMPYPLRTGLPSVDNPPRCRKTSPCIRLD
jgi:hypothetical protein